MHDEEEHTMTRARRLLFVCLGVLSTLTGCIWNPYRRRHRLPPRMADIEDRPRRRTSNAPTGSNASGNGSIGSARMLLRGLPPLFHPHPRGLPRRLRLTCDGNLPRPAQLLGLCTLDHGGAHPLSPVPDERAHCPGSCDGGGF